MTENKMTEAEIMNALECAVLYQTTDVRTYKGMPIEEFSKAILDLINRKNAEIAEKDAVIKRLLKEQYRTDVTREEIQRSVSTVMLRDMEFALETARAEAIKEFAERVKAKKRVWEDNGYWVQYIPLNEIDQIAKEMVGDTDV